jgi:hypothetical protein
MAPILDGELINRMKSSPHIPQDCYYFIMAVTVAALNRNEELAIILQNACEGKSQQEQLRIMRRTREALIKSVPVIGLPKIIIALSALKTITPSSLLDLPSAGTASSGMRTSDFVRVSAQDVLHRGERFWRTTYQGRSEEVMKRLDNIGTPDLGASARLMYSFFLSHEEILSGLETMFVDVAGMIVIDVSLG